MDKQRADPTGERHAGVILRADPGGPKLTVWRRCAKHDGGAGGSEWVCGFQSTVVQSLACPGLDDQHTVEVFYRIQLFKELAITPDVQYIKDPALNPKASSMWVWGLRARFAF